MWHVNTIQDTPVAWSMKPGIHKSVQTMDVTHILHHKLMPNAIDFNWAATKSPLMQTMNIQIG